MFVVGGALAALAAGRWAYDGALHIRSAELAGHRAEVEPPRLTRPGRSGTFAPGQALPAAPMIGSAQGEQHWEARI